MSVPEVWKDIFLGVLSYPNEVRDRRMRAQWEALGLGNHVWMYEGINLNDRRVQTVLTDPPSRGDAVRRTFSITWGHMDMIQKFMYHSNAPYAIFCENDLCLSRRLHEDVAWTMEKMRANDMEVVLMGFLNCLPPAAYPYTYGKHHASSDGETSDRTLYRYPDDYWGVQMYMISRSYARKLLDTFTLDYVRKSWEQDPSVASFSPDHTLSKLAAHDKRAFLFPMAAIEDGTTHYEHGGQHNFHQASFYQYYTPQTYFPPRLGDLEPPVITDSHPPQPEQEPEPEPEPEPTGEWETTQSVKEFNRAFGLEVPETVCTKYIHKKPELLELKWNLVREECAELGEAVQTTNAVEMLDALADILYVVHGFAVAMGWDLEEAFRRVHASNLSKLCASEEEAAETVQDYRARWRKGNSPYDSPAYRYHESIKKWVVFNVSTGKILKNIHYHSVELEDLVE